MPKYQTISMLRGAGLEQDRLEGNVPYLTPAERAPYEVTVILLDTVTPGSKSGRLFQGRKPVMKRMDTSDGTNPAGKYLFVMDGDGRVFAAPARAVVHHSAFLAGVTPRYVAGSGTLARQKELAQQPRFKAALERI